MDQELLAESRKEGKKELKIPTHYRCVNYNVWRFYELVHGGGPCISRKEQVMGFPSPTHATDFEITRHPVCLPLVVGHLLGVRDVAAAGRHSLANVGPHFPREMPTKTPVHTVFFDPASV
jgi:hypothetical protein